MKPIYVVAWLGRYVYRSIKKFDLFSQKIMLTYKGETSFSTLLGGIVSLMIFAIVAVYSSFLFQTMINRGNSNNSKSTAFVDLSIEDEDYYSMNYFDAIIKVSKYFIT